MSEQTKEELRAERDVYRDQFHTFRDAYERLCGEFIELQSRYAVLTEVDR